MIELCHLAKTYKDQDKEIVALEDVNLTIQDGEIYGIIGLSGAGKSTLVRCINLLERPTAGQVFIDGEDITVVPRKRLLELRRSIGMIFQGFHLLEQRSVLRNVTFPLEVSGAKPAMAKDKAMELLEIVGLSQRASSYPSQLSGGQKQRVAIARALTTDPKYLLCDEATSALDPNTTSSILDLLKKINQTMGVTIIVITHEMSVIGQICDKVAVLDQSRIAEEGKVSEVFVDPHSKIARELLLWNRKASFAIHGGRRIRLTLLEDDANRPLVSQMILECQAPVNIISATTREANGVRQGEMTLELPDESHAADRIIAWLNKSDIAWKEEA